MKSTNQLNRRNFLRYSGAILGSGAFLASCTSKALDPVPVIPIEPSPTPPAVEPNTATHTISCWGDSLTAGAGSKPHATLLKEAMPNRTVNNFGIGGQRAWQIAARQGGRAIEVSIEGNAFNGDQEIKITKLSVPFLDGSGQVRTSKGKLAGVACEIIRRIDSSTGKNVNVYTIKPLEASTVVVPEKSIFVSDDSQSTKTDTQILWLGRNDTSNLIPNRVPIEIQLCIDHLEKPARYVVIGIKNSIHEHANAQNAEDLKVYQDILTINKELAEKYPDNFIPSTPPTVEEMASINYAPSEQDNVDIANGTFPKGMLTDYVHLNDKGYQIITNRIIAFLKKNPTY